MPKKQKAPNGRVISKVKMKKDEYAKKLEKEFKKGLKAAGRFGKNILG